MITYEWTNEPKEGAITLYPITAFLVIVVGLVALWYLAIPIFIILLVMVLEPYIWRLFSKKNFIILVLILLFLNIIYLQELYFILISILAYLAGIAQSK